MAGFALKIKSKNGQNVLKNLTSKSTVADLKTALVTATNINKNYLNILYGFPPKPLSLSSNDCTLEQCGIVSGETLIVEEKITNIIPNKVSENLPRPHILESTMTRPGILIKQVVPADNSCLFTSIGFVLNGKVDTNVGSFMREIIANVVQNDTDNYSEAILGKPPSEYCKWIKKSESWGGAIELAVLSEFYGIEMAVVDTLNAIINRFGEDKNFSHRVFLMFDGIHYDPLFLEPFDGGEIQTLFLTSDESILKQAETLAMEAKSSRQFTDVDKFTLKCLVCGQFFKGQLQARSHAQESGHMNFGEV
ncbi:ubiquitin thioesterase OTU1 [Chrysoperla carnea]|uniref:ubiquitin thioesterase OTU1 n=1 Tax=Chrysoperla carnea TaxID=189513 RepID=UPI001D069AC7|nr:ubiquitin thioesterase OTU1 [Chrysoperla carnea]